MAWKEPSERHSEAMAQAIHAAANIVATAIREGFHHMADAETQALADLSTSVSALADAVTAEVAALTKAITDAKLIGTLPPTDNSVAIEASVTKLNQLTDALKASLPTAAPANPPATPPVTPPTTPPAGH